MELNDNQLISRYLEGDDRSFELLIGRYTDLIFRFVLGYVGNTDLAQDITQEVFVKVWKNSRKIDQKKSFKSWIYTIAKNTAFDYLKKKKAIPFSSFEDVAGKNFLTETLPDQGLLPDKACLATESKYQFLTAIKKLSQKYQLVLTLYYYQGLNFREIAQKLQEPINTIKSKHRRGILQLKKIVVDSF